MQDRSFTLRAVISGLLIGVLVNLCNTYYGLRVGAGSQMSIVSGLLGYVGFKLFSRYMTKQLTPEENVLVISVATATGCMPLTAGFIGIIPALEYLIGPDENGPLREGFGSLILWSIDLCFFGVIFAALLREHFIEREQLPWPGASATAHLINTLHHSSQKLQTEPHDELSNGEDHSGLSGAELEVTLVQGHEIEWKGAMSSLLRVAIASGIISILLNFIPILHELPVFGSQATNTWLWTVDLSPGFFGQGIIIGPSISLHMLIGAIFGWDILSPYAKHRGWAPGDVDDWTTGSRGWIIWVSLASLLADASVKLVWLIIQPFWRDYVASGYLQKRLIAFWDNYVSHQPPRPLDSQYSPIPDGSYVDLDSPQTNVTQETSLIPNINLASRGEQNKSPSGLITPRVLGLGFLLSLIICTSAVQFIFGTIIPWYFTLLAIALSLPTAAVGIRSIAETDYNPESAIISQLVFAMLISDSNPNVVIVNLIFAATAVAGANQSGNLAYDLKVGSIVGARPEAQIYRQIIGSLFGALISCGTYKIYASQYPIPGPLFRVPSAYLVLSTARLVLGRGLPEGVLPFALTAAALSMLSTIVKIRYAVQWWQKLIPSGVSFAIGIYLVPSFSITRALGGLFYWAYTHYRKRREDNVIVLASGLVLGESVASLVDVAFTPLHAPEPGGK